MRTGIELQQLFEKGKSLGMTETSTLFLASDGMAGCFAGICYAGLVGNPAKAASTLWEQVEECGFYSVALARLLDIPQELLDQISITHLHHGSEKVLEVLHKYDSERN